MGAFAPQRQFPDLDVDTIIRRESGLLLYETDKTRQKFDTLRWMLAQMGAHAGALSELIVAHPTARAPPPPHARSPRPKAPKPIGRRCGALRSC